ncbi:zinc finger protein chinmo isoform X3 [Anthonomus grandis grandis]|uniref:zinc finger protein chinmo isoform X3 n=1 Tax=Anthonomus grandis grandis TaxID=2921223 RepID=UPI00216519E9|nr:zinc finger protein chinmo isoform X3 [Anthonomus grandis grandis]
MEMRAHQIIHSGFEMDSQQQQFCLKWNSFGSNLATSFSNLFKSESLADVTLFCDGATFKAHKLILAACSKHLADLFETAPYHQNLLVILDGTSASNMAALLEFMYKGEVHVSQDALSSFLKAAECLQVKGLSIEHEKLAVAQSQTQRQQEMEAAALPLDSPTRKRFKILKEDTENNQPNHQQSSPSPSYSPKMSPYMPHPYRPYERLPTTNSQYELKHPRSPNDLVQENRASVLRDGSKQTASPTPHSMNYHRPSSSTSCSAPPHHSDVDVLPEAENNMYDGTDRATALICPETTKPDRCQDPGCPEDLRMKMEPAVQQDEPPSSTGGGTTGGHAPGLSPLNHVGSSPPNGNIGTTKTFEYDRDKTDLIPTTLWNSTTGKLSHHKQTTVNTPDGKKLKCPFCERLYGYETNLRAHIRQRHQGIRVPCPFCSRTFTRNNTVRRHIAREHKTEMSLKAFHNQQQP